MWLRSQAICQEIAKNNLLCSQADATFILHIFNRNDKLVLKEEDLTGPFVMPHPFWISPGKRWLCVCYLALSKGKINFSYMYNRRVVLNLGVRLLPPTRNWCIEVLSSLMIIYFKKDGSQVCEWRYYWYLKLARDLFSFEKDLHTFQRDRERASTHKLSKVNLCS